MDGQRRIEALERFEAAVELPLLLLALAMIPLLVIPLLVHVPGSVDDGLVAADWFIWAAFAFEFLVRLVLSPRKRRFVQHNWPDLLIVVLPFLRPLRIVRSARALRLLRLGRLAAFLSEFGKQASHVLRRHGLHYALVVAGIIVLGAALLIDAMEHGHGGNIRTFGDALWWAMATVTTVGYGDKYPITAAGRGVAAFLMVTGVALFGVLTANIAAFFVERSHRMVLEEQEQEVDEQIDPVVARLDEVLRRLEAMERRLATSGSS